MSTFPMGIYHTGDPAECSIATSLPGCWCWSSQGRFSCHSFVDISSSTLFAFLQARVANSLFLASSMSPWRKRIVDECENFYLCLPACHDNVVVASTALFKMSLGSVFLWLFSTVTYRCLLQANVSSPKAWVYNRHLGLAASKSHAVVAFPTPSPRRHGSTWWFLWENIE